MKKTFLLASLLCLCLILSGCTKKVVFLNQNIDTCGKMFDNFVKTTGYTYKVKDEENHIYNVLVSEYNMQYLLQSKPMFSYNIGFSCNFKEIGKNNTLMSCTTYNGNVGIWDIRRYLKELKQDDIKYISYKEYLKNRL